MTEIEKLHHQKAELTERRRKLNETNAHLKAKLLDTLPMPEYRKAEAARREIIRQIQVVESEFALLNAKIHSAHQQEVRDKQAEGPTRPIRMLIELRDYYQEFAADGTRSPTMRKMASEFVLKLNPIVRKSISKNQDD